MIINNSKLLAFLNSTPKQVTDIKDDLKILFSFRIFRYFFFISLLLKILLIVTFHPKSPSTFAPDEGTYARLAEWVSRGLAVQDFPDFGPNLYNQSRTLIGPSVLLIKAGINPLESVRITSLIFGLLFPILVLLCYVAISKSKKTLHDLNQDLNSPSLIFTILFLFFIPSNFLWSTLGLRESASQIWIMAQVYFLIKLYYGTRMNAPFFGFLALLSSTLSFGSRPQTALVLSIYILIIGFLMFLTKRRLSFAIFSILSIILGSAFTTTPEVKIKWQWTVVEKPKLENLENSQESTSIISTIAKRESSKCDYLGETIKVSEKVLVCRLTKSYEKPLLPEILQLPNNVDVSTLEVKRNQNRHDANSALAPSNCVTEISRVAIIGCNLSQIPYRLSAFLLRPFPIIDRGSFFLSIAGLENIVWAAFLLFSFINFMRLSNLSPVRDIVITIALFIILFSSAVSLYEGNLGTAFRHKSTIVGLLVLLNILTVSFRNLKKVKFASSIRK